MFKVGDKVKFTTTQPHYEAWYDEGVMTVIIDYENGDYELLYPDGMEQTVSGNDIATSGQWYIAGPMRGLPDFNFPAFHAAAEKLRAEGLYVFNPAETNHESIKLNADGDESKSEGFCRRTALAIDLNWIARYATGVAFLPGWEKSSGARAEHALAVALDLKMRYL